MLISLIVPTRERSTYLAECICTATAIDDPDIEIVVSDNASTDGTAEVMAAQRDPRIMSLRTERTGTADALRAARAASGGRAPSRRTVGATLAKPWSGIDGFKCSARIGGTNTVRTAAEGADAVLGGGMQSAVPLRTPLPGAGGWRGAPRPA